MAYLPYTNGYILHGKMQVQYSILDKFSPKNGTFPATETAKLGSLITRLTLVGMKYFIIHGNLRVPFKGAHRSWTPEALIWARGGVALDSHVIHQHDNSRPGGCFFGGKNRPKCDDISPLDKQPNKHRGRTLWGVGKTPSNSLGQWVKSLNHGSFGF